MEAESVPRLLITVGARPWPQPRAPLPALLQFDFDVPICKSMNNLCCPLIACGGVVPIVVALDANGGFGLLQIAAATSPGLCRSFLMLNLPISSPGHCFFFYSDHGEIGILIIGNHCECSAWLSLILETEDDFYFISWSTWDRNVLVMICYMWFIGPFEVSNFWLSFFFSKCWTSQMRHCWSKSFGASVFKEKRFLLWTGVCLQRISVWCYV